MEKWRISQLDVREEMSAPRIHKENKSTSVLSFYIFILSLPFFILASFTIGQFYQQTCQ